MLNPRTRLVNFRVTEQEYLLLREATAAQGARGLSDFARRAVMERVRDPAPSTSLEERVTSFEQSLSALTATLNRISEQLSTQTPARDGP